MDLKLTRKTFTEISTIGELSVNGKFFCYTLEDKVRDKKIPNLTAIPYGKYEVAVTFSNRFQCLMPLLLNVPNYEGVRIHWGNQAEDTDGCILLGKQKGRNFIGQSKNAFSDFMAEVKKASKGEKIFIEITQDTHNA